VYVCDVVVVVVVCCCCYGGGGRRRGGSLWGGEGEGEGQSDVISVGITLLVNAIAFLIFMLFSVYRC